MIPIPPALFAFFGKYWLHMAIAAGVLALAGVIYYEGGRAPRAERDKERAENAALTAQREAEDLEDVLESEGYVHELDAAYDERHARLNRTWDAELERVRLERDAATAASQSVRFRAEVCTDQAGNDRLSDAISEYRAGVRAAVADYRSAVGAQLKLCGRQAADYDEAVTWVERERIIWRPSEVP